MDLEEIISKKVLKKIKDELKGMNRNKKFMYLNRINQEIRKYQKKLRENGIREYEKKYGK